MPVTQGGLDAPYGRPSNRSSNRSAESHGRTEAAASGGTTAAIAAGANEALSRLRRASGTSPGGREPVS